NFNQGGIIIGSNYVRNSIRTNLTTDINSKLKFDLSSMLSRVDSDRKNSDKGNRGSSLISAMLSGYPTIGTHNPDGTYTNLSAAYGWGSNAIVNPLNWIEQENDKITSNKVLTNAALSYTPIKGLTFKVSGGIESTDDRTDYYQTKKFINSTGIASISTFRGTSLLNENTVSYNKQAGKHMISAVAGFTIQNYVSSGLNASGNGFVSDTQESFDIGAAANQGVPSSSYSKWTLLSYLARVNYTFNDKYLLTASFRADGSSRYSENQKWGTFPSASIAWRLSEEEFIKNISVISDLKVRAGYGESGSTAISPYQTLNQLASGKVVFGDALYTSYAPGTRLAGPLKWETTAQTDVGIDVGLFSNRILFTADYYVKNTRDLLNNVTLPASLGYLTTIRNVGEMQNKGFEFAVNAKILTGDFKWDVSANTSFNKNKIVKLYDGLDVLGGVINISVVGDNINILREGESVGSFYGYVENGYDANGYVTYTDFSGSGTRDALDKRIIGNPNPNMVYGFNSTMSYKNFELNVFIQGTQGNDIFNLSAVNQTNDYGQALNMPREVLYNHWTPETPNAKYPVIKTNSQPQISDRFVEDGSYMRFKNIQLTYTLPVAGLNINWLSNAQVYVSGQNLITFTKYSWYDPEVNSYGSSNSIQLGIDHYSYPAAKTYTVGLRLGF
ncbi:MAG: SusC/RagA family TonB-linked outer membrane protein, partial [Azospira oryzae]